MVLNLSKIDVLTFGYINEADLAFITIVVPETAKVIKM